MTTKNLTGNWYPITEETITGRLRWLARSPQSLKDRPHEKRLQYEVMITTHEYDGPTTRELEWRDVPLVFEGDA